MTKTLQQIKDEVSKEYLHPYGSWEENARFSNDDNVSVLEDSGAIDEVAIRYAQEQKRELVDMLEMHIYALDNGKLAFYEKYGFNSSELSFRVRELIKSATEVKG